MPESALSRKERDRLQREEDFLNAAERLFAERGYYQTSIEDVAQEAEYATGTIYRYFDSKADLYQRLLHRKGYPYFQELEASVAAAKSPLDKLRALIHGKVHFFFSNRAFMHIYLNEMPCQEGAMRRNAPEDLKKLQERYMQMLREVFHAGMKKRLFRKIDVDMTLAAFLGLINGILTHAVAEDSELSETQVEEFMIGFLQDGLIAPSRDVLS